jgi:2-dehydro-3-deoxygluconokinase
MAIGGDTSNVALGITKLGHPAIYITRKSNDFFGKKIQKAWEKENIDTSSVFIDNNHQTGIYFALFDSLGRHQFIYKRENSAAANFTVEDAKKVSLQDLKIFHLSGISQAISKQCLEASFYFMKKCKQLKIMVSYDLNYRSQLWSKEFFNSIAWFTIKKFANLVTLNLSEAQVLGLSGDPEEMIKEIRKLGPEFVALKLGKDGCIVSSSKGVEYFKSFDIPSNIETTGAGDALTAAIIVGILESMELKNIAYFANAVASIVCRSIGSASGQPTREEVERFIAIKKPDSNCNVFKKANNE